MKRSPWVVGSVLLWLLGIPAMAQLVAGQTAPAPGTPDRPIVFKSGVELVALNVTVIDSQQKFITGLARDDFEVFEDGARQDLSFFADSHVPLDLAILLDTSASMGESMPLVHEAAIGFTRTLGDGDRGSVVEFNDVMRVLEGFTGHLARLEHAIRQATARGGTALHNALYVTLKEFARETRQTQEVRRQAIVVLSDGQDTASLLTFEEVLDLARRTGVNIYTISLKSPYSRRKSGPHYFSQADYGMKTLAQETGGRAFFPVRVEELAGIYSTIADDLSHQYSIGYVSKNPRRDGAFRRVVVRVFSRPDARLRARTGYFAGVANAVAMK